MSSLVNVDMGKCSVCGVKTESLHDGKCEACMRMSVYKSEFATPSLFEKRIFKVWAGTKSFKRIKTRHTMSRLNKSAPDKTEHFDILLLKNYWFGNDLVVVPELPKGGHCTSGYGCTISELKVDADGSIRNYLADVSEDTIAKVPLEGGRIFYLWREAYTLNAMTYRDMNYGDRWYGPYCVEEGNKFGDTSKFYIIGHIEREE